MEIPNQQFLLQILDDAIAKCSQKPDDKDCLLVKAGLLTLKGACTVDMEHLLEYSHINHVITTEARKLLQAKHSELQAATGQESASSKQPIGFTNVR